MSSPVDPTPPGLPDAVVQLPPTDAVRVVRNHRRFALSEVTFDGGPVGGATIDAWQNATGAECWSARVVMAPADVQTAGSLAGRTRDGRALRGRVALVSPAPSNRPRGSVLIVWRGVSPLLDDAPAAEG